MSGASAGVRMSSLAKWIWKPDTPASEPAGARISAGKSGEGRQVVAGEGGRLGELRPGQLHAIAGVPGKSDGYSLDLLDRLLGGHGLRGLLRGSC